MYWLLALQDLLTNVLRQVWLTLLIYRSAPPFVRNQLYEVNRSFDKLDTKSANRTRYLVLVIPSRALLLSLTGFCDLIPRLLQVPSYQEQFRAPARSAHRRSTRSKVAIEFVDFYMACNNLRLLELNET